MSQKKILFFFMSFILMEINEVLSQKIWKNSRRKIKFKTSPQFHPNIIINTGNKRKEIKKIYFDHFMMFVDCQVFSGYTNSRALFRSLNILKLSMRFLKHQSIITKKASDVK